MHIDELIAVHALMQTQTQTRGEWLLQTHTLTGQNKPLPSSDWIRADKLYPLSNQSMSTSTADQLFS